MCYLFHAPKLLLLLLLTFYLKLEDLYSSAKKLKSNLHQFKKQKTKIKQQQQQQQTSKQLQQQQQNKQKNYV